jgi:2-haloacid dehalogenase
MFYERLRGDSDACGQQLPCRSLARAAAIHPITDTKVAFPVAAVTGHKRTKTAQSANCSLSDRSQSPQFHLRGDPKPARTWRNMLGEASFHHYCGSPMVISQFWNRAAKAKRVSWVGRLQKESSNMAALPLVVFDVNETLLDLGTMEPTFQRIFGDKNAMRLWFDNLILYSAALTVAGCYVPFTDIGSAVMKMLADTRRIKINDNDKKELTEMFSTMPPYAEVPAALRKLRKAGFRLFCLTDNLLEVQTRQLEHGGIVDLFERRFSADGVKHHKPSREAYAYVE